MARGTASIGLTSPPGGSIAAAPLINPSVASQGEMWTMLMQMIPSADAIGQTGLEASSAMGARSSRLWHSPMRRHSAGHPDQDRKVGKQGLGDFSQNERHARLSRLRFRG